MTLADTWYEIVFPPVVTLIVIVIGAILLWLARGALAQLIAQLGVQRVSVAGFNVEFTEQRAAEAYKKQGLGPPSENDRAAIRDAALYLVPLVAQSRVLWVDNDPGGNALERSTMLSWEVDVQAARSTEEAVRELEDARQRFDLVISDWRRPGDSPEKPAGPALARAMADLQLEPRPRIVFYHGPVKQDELNRRRHEAEGLRAIGATGSPGELFRWCLIELARVALDSPRPEQRERRHRWSTPEEPQMTE
jgi:CheY-like chemotaxis protein